MTRMGGFIQMTTYLPIAEYESLIDGFLHGATAPVCPHCGNADRNELKAKIGEKLDIWPATIREEATA
jgi:hypothetical protein